MLSRVPRAERECEIRLAGSIDRRLAGVNSVDRYLEGWYTCTCTFLQARYPKDFEFRFDKGCYNGQEIESRVRGKNRRRTVHGNAYLTCRASIVMKASRHMLSYAFNDHQICTKTPLIGIGRYMHIPFLRFKYIQRYSKTKNYINSFFLVVPLFYLSHMLCSIPPLFVDDQKSKCIRGLRTR
jgi:hypothetical protein